MGARDRDGVNRGVYRGVYSSLLDDDDFQRLSSDARLTFFACRLCVQAGPAAIFRYYPEVLAKQTGLPIARVRRALEELVTGCWLFIEEPIIWVRNGLMYDPHTRPNNPKHLTSITRWLESLPRKAIVLRFCDYYKIAYPFDSPSVPITGSGRVGLSEKESEEDREGTGTGDAERSAERNGTGVDHQAKDVLEWLNRKAGKSYRPSKATLDLIRARLSSGIEDWQLKAIVSRKVRQWQGDPKMRDYLRPETLFNATKCESYLGELPPPRDDDDDEE